MAFTVCGNTRHEWSKGSDYNVHGLDLSPDAARRLSFEQACKQVIGLRILSEHDVFLEAAKGEDYSVLLYFNKTGGLSEAVIGSNTTSHFLGMGTPQPESVWAKLGYRLLENLGQEQTWTNGDAKIIASYGRPGSLNEIHYVIPHKTSIVEADTEAWRTVEFFGGGRGCIETANMVSGQCYATEDAAHDVIHYITQEWKGALPQGFWLMQAEAHDASSGCRYWIGCDFQHENTWQAAIEAMREAGRLPKGASLSFHLAPSDFFTQTLVGTVHIRGILPSPSAPTLSQPTMQAQTPAPSEATPRHEDAINDQLDSLVRQLRDTTEHVRAAAVEAIGDLGDQRAVGPLVEKLHRDDSAEVRARACIALGKLGDRRAVEPLITALEDKHEYVAKHAAEALGSLGDVRAIAPLVRANQNKERFLVCCSTFTALEAIRKRT